jgi:hypothetical protein
LPLLAARVAKLFRSFNETMLSIRALTGCGPLVGHMIDCLSGHFALS